MTCGSAAAHFVQLRFLLERLLQGHFQIIGNQLGNPVNIAIGHVQRPPDIPHDRLGPHGAEGDDLTDAVAAVLFDHVLDHLATAVLAEVNVDIRHGDTFRIEETFEQQVVRERVEIGDLDGIRHQRTGCRAPARADRDPLVLGPADKVGDDQEIGRKFHVADTVQLDLQAVKVLLLLLQRHVGIFGQDGYHPLFEPFGRQITQHVVVVLPCGRDRSAGSNRSCRPPADRDCSARLLSGCC